MFDLGEYVIDVDDIGRESLQRIVDKAYANRSILAAPIRSELLAVRQRSRRSAQIVKGRFGDKLYFAEVTASSFITHFIEVLASF